MVCNLLHRRAYVIHTHIVEQDGLCPVLQCLIEFLKRADLDFQGLLAPPIVPGTFQCGADAARQCYMIVLDEYTVR